MSLGAAITEFFGTPAGAAIVALFALAALDFALGAFAAFRDDVFTLDALSVWVRKHIAGRVLPITAVLIVGHMTGGLSFEGGEVVSPGTVLTALGLGMAATYVLETVASIRESLTAKPGTREVPNE